MLKGAREVCLDWPVSNALLKPMRDAMIAENLTEPTEDMLLANFMQRQALFASENGLDGRIRKIIGSVEESMDSSSCCAQQCALGRSARGLGRAICAAHPRQGTFRTNASPTSMGLALDAASTPSAVCLLQMGCMVAAALLLPQEQRSAHGRAASVHRLRRNAREGSGHRLRREAHHPLGSRVRKGVSICWRLRLRSLHEYCAAFERCRSSPHYYIAPEGATLMAVEVSGRKLLEWLEDALDIPSYFQTQQLVLGFDGSLDRPCRINVLQVGKKLRFRPALL
jgi:hypothetical protein